MLLSLKGQQKSIVLCWLQAIDNQMLWLDGPLWFFKWLQDVLSSNLQETIKNKVYYSQVLEITWHTWGHTAGSQTMREQTWVLLLLWLRVETWVSWIHSLFYNFFKVYLFIFRDRACEQERSRERGRGRIPRRLCTASTKPDVGLKPMNLRS